MVTIHEYMKWKRPLIFDLSLFIFEFKLEQQVKEGN